MSIIVNTEVIYRTPSLPSARPAPGRQSQASRTLDGDSVDLSRFGRALASAAEESSLRIARTNAIRSEIINETYETPERINGTVERLLDVIG